jgi:hypothetical protein
MNDDGRQQAFMSAQVTERFVLQSARGATTSEASGRAALYLTSVTGALVALGFVAQVGEQFDAFAAVLPAVFLLGEFTYGVAAAVLVFALHLWHQRRRFTQMIDRPADAGTVTPSQLHRP